MASKAVSQKVECLNPNTGRNMRIEKETYDFFSKAIHHTLKNNQPLTYTQIVDGINDYLKQHKTKFDGSVSWYAVTVKHDMHARGIIEVFAEKGKKLHRIKKNKKLLITRNRIIDPVSCPTFLRNICNAKNSFFYKPPGQNDFK